jgi:hypothetical protein
MSGDLAKAKSALAAGRPEEARMYAWTAAGSLVSEALLAWIQGPDRKRGQTPDCSTSSGRPCGADDTASSGVGSREFSDSLQVS